MEIARLDSLGAAALDVDSLRADLVTRAHDVRTVLRLHVAQGRALFRRLLPEPIEMEPVVRNGTPGYRFTGRLSVAGLLSGEAYAASGMGGISCA